MNTELKRLQSELRAMQDELDRAWDEDEALRINAMCGQLRREIRNRQQLNRKIRESQPRFTERGRS